VNARNARALEKARAFRVFAEEKGEDIFRTSGQRRKRTVRVQQWKSVNVVESCTRRVGARIEVRWLIDGDTRITPLVGETLFSGIHVRYVGYVGIVDDGPIRVHVGIHTVRTDGVCIGWHNHIVRARAGIDVIGWVAGSIGWIAGVGSRCIAFRISPGVLHGAAGIRRCGFRVGAACYQREHQRQ
jgi:hypothetical protein